jgi:hypothetical protein
MSDAPVPSEIPAWLHTQHLLSFLFKHEDVRHVPLPLQRLVVVTATLTLSACERELGTLRFFPSQPLVLFHGGKGHRISFDRGSEGRGGVRCVENALLVRYGLECGCSRCTLVTRIRRASDIASGVLLLPLRNADRQRCTLCVRIFAGQHFTGSMIKS